MLNMAIFYKACLKVAKASGLFMASRAATDGMLRILCYHGFETDDECQFRPGLFIKPSTFDDRMELLARRYRVLPLAEGLARLQEETLPRNAVCITVDDGFHSTKNAITDSCVTRGLPVTVYVTTYYMDRQSPVFRLAVQYMFWRTKVHAADLSELVGSELRWQRHSENEDRSMWQLIAHGESLESQEKRDELCEKLGAILQVSYNEICESRKFNILAPEHVRALSDIGVDIQLHTHRHRFPEDPAAAMKEIADNRQSLEAVVEGPLNHFCYPSGIWSPRHIPVLRDAKITSAAVCRPGLNGAYANPFALGRFADSDLVQKLWFEGELCGFLEACRRLRTSIRRPLARLATGRPT